MWMRKFDSNSLTCPRMAKFAQMRMVTMLSLAKKAVVDPLRGVLGFSLGIPAAVLVGPVRLICAESSQAINDDVKTMAKMSNVMYKERNQREAEARTHGWQLLHPFNEAKHAIFTKGTVLLVAFQGTFERRDHLKNAMLLFNLNDLVPLDEVKSALRQALDIRPDITSVKVTGHSLGGALAAMLAKAVKEDPYFGRFGGDIGGHIFSPGSALDLDKYLTEERLSNIVAHHVVGDLVSAGWSKTALVNYKPRVKELMHPHALENFLI